MRIGKSVKMIALGVVLAGVPAVWSLSVHAASPTVPAVSSLDADDKYIKPLREDRTKLEEVVVDLKSEATDPHGHRHLAIDNIEKAIKNISDEIGEYKTDDKK